jgi:hypothetical protein
MRSILFLLVVALFFSCGENHEVKTPGTIGASADVKEIVKHFDPASITKLNVADIPVSCVTKGEVISAFKWTDKLGENVFIATETGEIPSSKVYSEIALSDAHVYAYHYVIQENQVKLIRELHDFVSECNFDINASFIPRTIHITDLNSDDTGEIWMMYKTYCLSDASPSDLKIMMFQNGQKYAIRGNSLMDLGNQDIYGGDYKMDEAFSSGPSVFRDFAKSMWKDHIEGN